MADGDDLEKAFADWEDDADQGLDGSAVLQVDTDGPCGEEFSDSRADAASMLGLRPHDGPEQKKKLGLLNLPREMLLRVLSLVPATGLTSAACTCTSLASLASEDSLWRRLYNSRWGKPGQQVSASGKQWKRSYLDADGEEWEATRRRGDDDGDSAVGAIFLDMLRAKRDTAPDRRLLDSHLGADPGDIAAKVAVWRRSRGFTEPGGVIGGGGGPSSSGASTSAAATAPQPPARPDLSHRGRAALTFTRINPGEQPPVYACDQSGWVHVCGDTCTEGVVDARSELLVCPVSGQTTDRLVHECEEDEAYGRRCGAGGAGGEEEAGLGVFGGGFGQFWTLGYECENVKQLNNLLGFKAL